jgi:hypothetical protein
MSKNAARAKKVPSPKTLGAKRAAAKPAKSKSDEDLDAEDEVETAELDEDEYVLLDDEEADLTLELYSSDEVEDEAEDVPDVAESGEIVEELRENPIEEVSEEDDEVVEILGGLEAVIGFDDTVQKRQRGRTVEEDDDDDDESYLVLEKQSYEFLCQGCYLVRNKAQQRGVDPVLCIDCF